MVCSRKGGLLAAILVCLGVAGTSAQSSLCPSSEGSSHYDYKQALCLSILFYEAERSGALPPEQRILWRGDSAMTDGADNGVDLTGGYYDAGDHVKFHFPMASSLTMLSWGIIAFPDGYTSAGQLEHAKDAIKWGTDYFLKCNTANMTLFAQVGDAELDHAYWGRPEDMTMDRPSLKIDTESPGSELAGEVAAAFAAASIVFADSDTDYSQELLEVAREMFLFADQYRGFYHDSLPGIGSYYDSSFYGDELCWAAAWLYKATGEQVYADRAAELWVEFDMGQTPYLFDWGTKNAGAQLLYTELFDDPAYATAVQLFTDSIRSAPHTPGGLVYLNQWGSLRHAMNAAFAALRAADLGIDAEINRAWAAQQAEYVLGSSGRSYVIGYGIDFPQRPHHRSSSCPDLSEPCDGDVALNQPGPNPHTLYGALVGGPDSVDGYTDERNDYVHNEVACDYNAAFVGVMAALAALTQ